MATLTNTAKQMLIDQYLHKNYVDHFFREYHRLFTCLPNHKGLRKSFEKRAEEIRKRCPDVYDIEQAAPFILELLKLYQRMVAWHEHREAQRKIAQSRHRTYGRKGL